MLVAFRVLVISFAVSLRAQSQNASCEQLDLKPLIKNNIAACIAQCLKLDSKSASCYYKSGSGTAIENNNNQEGGCPKCYFPAKFITYYKRIADFLKFQSYSLCGRRINFAPLSVPGGIIYASLLCGILQPNMKQWMPRDYDEVRCMIEGLTETIQKFGKLRVNVFKDVCSKEFFFCSAENPRSLRKSFMDEELNRGNQTMTFPNGTCAHFDFKMKEKKVSTVQLRVADCMENSYTICEHDD